jgi:hypothetical protein
VCVCVPSCVSPSLNLFPSLPTQNAVALAVPHMALATQSKGLLLPCVRLLLTSSSEQFSPGVVLGTCDVHMPTCRLRTPCVSAHARVFILRSRAALTRVVPSPRAEQFEWAGLFEVPKNSYSFVLRKIGAPPQYAVGTMKVMAPLLSLSLSLCLLGPVRTHERRSCFQEHSRENNLPLTVQSPHPPTHPAAATPRRTCTRARIHGGSCDHSQRGVAVGPVLARWCHGRNISPSLSGTQLSRPHTVANTVACTALCTDGHDWCEQWVCGSTRSGGRGRKPRACPQHFTVRFDLVRWDDGARGGRLQHCHVRNNTTDRCRQPTASLKHMTRCA